MQRSKVRAIVLEDYFNKIVYPMNSQIVAGIQPLQNLGNVSVIAKLCGNPEIGKAYAKKSIEDGLQKLEQILEKTSGKYAFGDSITMADVCIVPQVYNAIRFGVNMDAYPVIKRIDASLQDIDAIKKSHPSQQPDAVNQ
ncbi:unnamed protein product [Anisakis simplex]|uniref:Maleylacetoacetate isomerase (inferred by orthology to a human protein) n=1 Tax=Anisakis simplex TaxID=6269 RepID=A0A0M3K093_ANISI|nr:unnamed protein product [Anisakis simplex]